MTRRAPGTRSTARRAASFLPFAAAVVISACSSGGDGYINPDIDFGYMERVAVLPFENLSSDDLAAKRVHSVFLTEFLEADVLQVVDVGETISVMRSLGLGTGSKLTPQQAVTLGERLKVDALVFGIVEEYGISRTDRKRGPEVTLVLGMTETETGTVIWRAQANATGSSTLKRIMGGSPSSLYDVSRTAVRRALGTLL